MLLILDITKISLFLLTNQPFLQKTVLHTQPFGSKASAAAASFALVDLPNLSAGIITINTPVDPLFGGCQISGLPALAFLVFFFGGRHDRKGGFRYILDEIYCTYINIHIYIYKMLQGPFCIIWRLSAEGDRISYLHIYIYIYIHINTHRREKKETAK